MSIFSFTMPELRCRTGSGSRTHSSKISGILHSWPCAILQESRKDANWSLPIARALLSCFPNFRARLLADSYPCYAIHPAGHASISSLAIRRTSFCGKQAASTNSPRRPGFPRGRQQSCFRSDLLTCSRFTAALHSPSIFLSGLLQPPSAIISRLI